MRLCHPPDGSTSSKYKLLCFITTKNYCKEKNTLAFNRDRCSHLVLCLQLMPFHSIIKNFFVVDGLVKISQSVVLGQFYQVSLIFAIKTLPKWSTLQDTSLCVGHWPYLQTLDQAGKARQGQTLQLFCPNGIYEEKSFITLAPVACTINVLRS